MEREQKQHPEALTSDLKLKLYNVFTNLGAEEKQKYEQQLKEQQQKYQQQLLEYDASFQTQGEQAQEKPRQQIFSLRNKYIKMWYGQNKHIKQGPEKLQKFNEDFQNIPGMVKKQIQEQIEKEKEMYQLELEQYYQKTGQQRPPANNRARQRKKNTVNIFQEESRTNQNQKLYDQSSGGECEKSLTDNGSLIDDSSSFENTEIESNLNENVDDQNSKQINENIDSNDKLASNQKKTKVYKVTSRGVVLKEIIN